MSIADIICSRVWTSYGANDIPVTGVGVPKTPYYPTPGITFRATKRVLQIPSKAINYFKPLPPPPPAPQQINTTPVDLTYIQFTVTDPTVPPVYNSTYKANFEGAQFYEYADYLVSSPIMAKFGATPADTLYVTHVVSVIPAQGSYAMLMRSFWSDGQLGAYWCC